MINNIIRPPTIINDSSKLNLHYNQDSKFTSYINEIYGKFMINHVLTSGFTLVQFYDNIDYVKLNYPTLSNVDYLILRMRISGFSYCEYFHCRDNLLLSNEKEEFNRKLVDEDIFNMIYMTTEKIGYNKEDCINYIKTYNSLYSLSVIPSEFIDDEIIDVFIKYTTSIDSDLEYYKYINGHEFINLRIKLSSIFRDKRKLVQYILNNLNKKTHRNKFLKKCINLGDYKLIKSKYLKKLFLKKNKFIVPEEYLKNKEFISYFVKKVPDCFKDIPEKYKTSKMCKRAIKYNMNNTKHVPIIFIKSVNFY